MVFFMVKFLVVMDATDTKNIKKLLHVNRVCVENFNRLVPCFARQWDFKGLILTFSM